NGIQLRLRKNFPMPFRIVYSQINTTAMLQPSAFALLFAPYIPARGRGRNLTFLLHVAGHIAD
ncbi:MAG TPA: hypothetical protein VKE91_00915, partial [Blastocatellia bacterium]|nr:hypothetical protein [Blastocatellia bacterium]